MQSLPDSQCSYNLHLLVCRLHRQEAARGATGKDWELWGERLVQRVKRLVKFRTTAHGEVKIVNDLLMSDALWALRCDESSGVRDFDEMVPAYRAAPLAGPQYDDGADNGTQLLHTRMPVPRRELSKERKDLAWFLHVYRAEGWCEADAGAAALDRFRAASKRGDETIKSEKFAGQSPRPSYFVVVRIDYGRGQYTGPAAREHVAKVHYFLRARKAGAPTLRLAFCEVYGPLPDREGMLYARTGNVIQSGFLHVDAIDTKVATARPPAGDVIYGLRYAIASGLN